MQGHGAEPFCVKCEGTELPSWGAAGDQEASPPSLSTPGKRIAPHHSVGLHTVSDSHTHGPPLEGQFGGHVPRALSGRGLGDWSPAKSWAGVLGCLLQEEFLLCVEGTEPWAPDLTLDPICSLPLQAGAWEATAAVAPVRVNGARFGPPRLRRQPSAAGGATHLNSNCRSLSTPSHFSSPVLPVC